MNDDSTVEGDVPVSEPAAARLARPQPRVLLLSWYGPGAVDAGERIRLAELAAGLRADFNVKWGVVDQTDVDSVGSDPVSACPPSPATTYRMRPIDYLRATLALRAIEQSRLGSHREIRAWAAQLIEEFSPDAIWVNQPFMWPLVPASWRSRTILDTHNVNSARLDRIARSRGSLPSRAMASLQAILTRGFERKYVAESASTIAVSKSDAELFRSRSRGAGNVVVLPNGASLLHSASGLALGPSECPKLLFLGSLSYSANVDAIRRLAAWVQQADLDVHVTVAGSGRSEEVEQLCNQVPQLHFVGRVASAREAMISHHALIATHVQGGGSRIKVLEALASRLLVIGTEVAVEGLDLSDRVNFLSVESSTDLERAIEFMRAGDEVSRLVDAGWRVAEKHQWSSIAAEGATLVEAVLRANRATA